MLADPYLPGWPFWVWLLILGGLFTGMSFEYAFHTVGKRHHKPPPKPAAVSTHKHGEKPKYAPPKEAAEMDVRKLTNKQLGRLMGALSDDIGEMLLTTMRATGSPQIEIFHRSFAKRFYWLYEEARRRGYRDADLDRYYDRAENLLNVSHLNQQLRLLAVLIPNLADEQHNT